MRKVSALVLALLLTAPVLPSAAQHVAVAQSSGLHTAPKPADVRADWKAIIGEYAHDAGVINILERDGRLFLSMGPGSLVEMKQEGPARFNANATQIRIGSRGLTIPTVVVNGQQYTKRLLGDSTHSFRIEPLRPVAELRAEALNTKPPVEHGKRQPDLVELTLLDPTIKLDIRYAKSNNFMGTPFYAEERAFLQRPAAEALVRANRQLRQYGYGLLIHDAYRPWYVTKMFWDATPADKKEFVADPAKGSNHNRGGAVDLSLYELKTGREVEMPGGYDEMSDRSYPDYRGGTSLQRWRRDLLRAVVESHGFKVYRLEWWHFDYEDWRSYPILNKSFSELSRGKADSNSSP